MSDPIDPRDERLLHLVPPPDATDGPCVDDALLLAWLARRGREAETETQAEATEIDRHLVSCGRCRALLAALAQPGAPALESWAIEGLEARGRLRRRRVLGGGALIAAAAAAMVVALAPPPPLPEYRMDGPYGGVRASRSAGPSNLFLPTSALKLTLAPVDPEADEILSIAVYVAETGGTLRRARGALVTPGAGGAYRVEAEAGPLLGTAFGARRIYVVLGASDAAVARLEGRPEASLREGPPAVRIIPLQLDYQPTVPALGGDRP